MGARRGQKTQPNPPREENPWEGVCVGWAGFGPAFLEKQAAAWASACLRIPRVLLSPVLSVVRLTYLPDPRVSTGEENVRETT